ncbi:alpha/beta hydrolase [Phormidium tenue FACHB-886]|nr:alpha/beta hydrolase [Phormidium tenue FACHB-886]
MLTLGRILFGGGLLLGFVGLFLSLWIVVPAPNFALLRLAVGAPEASPWLFGLNTIAILLLLFSHRKGGLYSLALACSVAALALSAYPLSQFPAANREVNGIMYRSLGLDYRSKIPAALDTKLRPQPLVLSDVFRGIPMGEVRVQTDIIFAGPDGVPLSLAVYQPNETGKHPTIVTIYGGGWQSGKPTQDEFFNRYMAAQGYTVVAIDYRHAPQFRFPAQLDDVKTALAYIRTNADRLEADINRLVLMGRSAGAHLAMLAAYPPGSPAVRAVVNYYGPVDLTVGYNDSPQPDPLDTRALLRSLLGGTPAEVPDLYRAASPATYVRGNLPPSLLVYAGRDHVVQAKFGRDLRDRLTATGSQVVYIELPWSEHAFDAVFNGVGNQLALYYTERFIAWAVSDRA